MIRPLERIMSDIICKAKIILLVSLSSMSIVFLFLKGNKVYESKPTNLSEYYKGKKKMINCSNENASTFYGSNHFLNLAVPTDIARYLNKLGFTDDRSPSKVSKISDTPVALFAASSNHFLELKELLKDLHHKLLWLFPKTKLIFYDLGLRQNENQWMKKFCKCEARQFPFSSFPKHFQRLKTYAWKPVIMQMVLKEFNFVMYMDASIRLKISDLSDLYRTALGLGFMYLYNDHLIPYKVAQHTQVSMFQFFHLEVCLFKEVIEYQATMVMIVNNRITHDVLMKWWVICALREDCIAPKGTDKLLHCDSQIQKIGKCHRFDQSALNLIAYSIFKHPKLHIIPFDVIDVRRH